VITYHLKKEEKKESFTEKNGFVTATKLGTTSNFLLLQPKILLRQPNVLLIELYILLLRQNIFAIPILTNDFVGITKSFFFHVYVRNWLLH